MCKENKQRALFTPRESPRPHFGQMDCPLLHETSSLAQAEKRGGKAVCIANQAF